MSEELDRKRQEYGDTVTAYLQQLAEEIDALAGETWRGDLRECDDYRAVKAELQKALDNVCRLLPSSDGAIHFVRKIMIRPATRAASLRELVQMHEDLLRLLVTRGYRIG